MRRSVLLLLAASLVLALAAAGCGGDGGDEGEPVTVQVFFPRGDGGPDCDEVFPVDRMVEGPDTLRAALEALLEGPTEEERAQGYGGWFSAETAGMLRSVSIADGVAEVDFADFREVIPNASTSCGSTMLLAQLDRTATQFPSVERAVYSFEGDVDAFYEWLQRPAP